MWNFTNSWKDNFENGDIFQPFEYIYTGQKTGMDSKSISNITGFVTVPDEVGEINTPNGVTTICTACRYD